METSADKILGEFFRGLKIAVGNASIYEPGHSVFTKSIEDLQAKTESALVALGTLEILFAPRYLVVDDVKWENDPLYEDLAKFFHHRSLKNLKIQSGVSLEEMKFFISQASLRPPELMEKGGLETILKNQGTVHISAEMLDFSDILQSTKEDKDIWKFLLKKAVDDENMEQIEILADNFRQIIRDFGVRNFLEDASLAQSAEKFLSYLKDNREGRFLECVMLVFESLLRDKEAIRNIPLTDLVKECFQSLNKSDLTEALFNELLDDEISDLTAIDLYTQFLDEETHKTIAENLIEKIKNKSSRKINLEWMKKTIILLGESNNAVVSEIYHPVFSSAIENIDFEHVFIFDRDGLPQHYRNILLSLFEQEKRREWLKLIIDKIFEELKKMPSAKKFEYSKSLRKIVTERSNEDFSLSSLFKEVDHKTTQFIEKMILQGEEAADLKHFINTLDGGTMGSDAYINTIFKERKITPYLIAALLKFYPDKMNLFYEKLKQKTSDTNFLLALIKSTESFLPLLRIDILKNIFSGSNDYIKIEVLKIMQTVSEIDRSFLFSILKSDTNSPDIKEQALLNLARDEKARKKAVQILLSASASLGKKNTALQNNIKVIGRVKLTEAKGELEAISKKGQFWNKNLREEALAVLEEWNSGND